MSRVKKPETSGRTRTEGLYIAVMDVRSAAKDLLSLYEWPRSRHRLKMGNADVHRLGSVTSIAVKASADGLPDWLNSPFSANA